nr:hypothetical protein [uncultured Desulfobacter sp.]
MGKHNKASRVHSKTQDHLIRAAKKMNHSIEQRIDKIQIRADEKIFISIVPSDTFPDKLTDGDIVGFVDVSGFGDRLPNGQYGIKIYFDEKNPNKPSEFINVNTGEQYLFDTDTKKIEAPDAISASELSITTEECIWITVPWENLSGDIFYFDICLNCPECYN